MTALTYGREALRRFREQQQNPADVRRHEIAPPPDAPTDDATLTVWNGERFLAYEKWLATAPLAIDEVQKPSVFQPGANCVTGTCGGVRIWVVRDGDRWLMFAGARSARGRRRDFASPFLSHAIRTAEGWYGAPAGGWREEEGCDGTKAERTGVGVTSG